MSESKASEYIHEGKSRKHPVLVPVHSSNVAKVGWDEVEAGVGTLFVLFHNGGFYMYRKVPQDVAVELVNAPSIGQYLARHVRDVYKYDQLETPDSATRAMPDKKEIGQDTIPWMKLKPKNTVKKTKAKK